MKTLKKALALFLALMMILSVSGTAYAIDQVFPDNPFPADESDWTVVVNPTGSGISVTIDGEVPAGAPPTGSTVTSLAARDTGDEATSVTINDKTYSGEVLEWSGGGYYADTYVNGNVSGGGVSIDNTWVSIDGSVTNNGGNGISSNGGDYAVSGNVTGSTGGIKSVDSGDTYSWSYVGGDVKGDSGAGVDAASSNGAGVVLRVAGSVTGSTDGLVVNSTGADSYNDGSSVRIRVENNVTGTSNNGIAATTANTGGDPYDYDDSYDDTHIEVGGNVTGGQTGVMAESTAGYTVVSIEGTVKGGAGDGVKASSASNENGNGFTIVITEGAIEGGANGINAESKAEDGGESSDTIVYGNDNVTGAENGVKAFSGSKGYTEVSVEGNVTGAGEAGIYAESKGGHVAGVLVGGDVTGSTAGVVAKAERIRNGVDSVQAGVWVIGDVVGNVGMVLNNNLGIVTAIVADMDEDSNLEMATNITTSAAEADLHNVTAETGAGIFVKEHSEGSYTDVTIDGVLSAAGEAGAGGGKPILLADDVTETAAGEIGITVWKIEGQAEGADVVYGGQGDAAAVLQSRIQYLIKIAPDEDSQRVFSAYEGGETRLEGEQEIEVNVPNGFELTAYATDGTEVPITRHDDGKYYAVIPTGGGIYLHATLTRLPSAGEEFAFNVKVKQAGTLFSVVDESSSITLTFFDDGSYEAKHADGRTENGTVKLDNGKIVLVSDDGVEMPVGDDGKLVFVSKLVPNASFKVQLKQEQLEQIRKILA